jgi:sortase (surface protein transpeptidase)
MIETDAWQLYIRAVIRAQDSRHILTWTPEDLFAAYIIASIPSCKFSEFCRQMQITIEEVEEDTEQEQEQEQEPAERTPEEVDKINENAIQFMTKMSAVTGDIKIEAVKPVVGG